ncbi:phosphoenolpyruvate hydrolase family protein, partial [Bilophila wadsworthia]
PYADANGIVLKAFDDALTSCPVPILAGICAADPFREHGQLIESIKNKGFKGVCNLPSMALMDGSLRTIVEEQGLGFEREAQLMAIARDKGLYTLALVASPQEADIMLAVGVDALLLHLGIAFEESPTLQIDNYLVEIVSLSNRISSDYPLFACSVAPRHLERLAHSLPNLSGFYAIRSLENAGAV